MNWFNMAHDATWAMFQGVVPDATRKDWNDMKPYPSDSGGVCQWMYLSSDETPVGMSSFDTCPWQMNTEAKSHLRWRV